MEDDCMPRLIIITVTAVALVLSAGRPAYVQVPPSPGSNPVTIFSLTHCEAEPTARRLRAFLGKDSGAEVEFSRERNAVFVRAAPADVERARNLVRRVDVEIVFRTTKVRFADAESVGRSVRVVLAFLAARGDDRPARIVADKQTRSITITASQDKAEQVWNLIRAFDRAEKK
jgi:type II secretory pathway component GspD/PulD (secretin)